MEGQTKIRAIYNGAADAIQIFVSKTENGTKMYGKMVYEYISEGAYQPATIQLQLQDLQRLMDDMWQMGIRPAGEGHTGQIAAMKEHLNDLKKIAGKFLKIEL